MYIDKLDDIVDKYHTNFHRTIKINPINVKRNTYIDFDVENNDKNPKLKVGDPVRISKYKQNLQKVTLRIGQKMFLWLEKLKILYHGHA